MNNEQRPGYQRIRSTMHVGMGILYLLLGGIAIGMKFFGRVALEPGKAYLLGGLLMAYGVFRLWRGITQLRAGRQDA